MNTNYEKSNSSHENFTNIRSSQAIFEEKILKIKNIILYLKQSRDINLQIQKSLTGKYEKLSEKQILIEKTLEKIKRINKSKQKKHIKYLKYTPLNKVYYYCPKKIHYYYILMDLVIKSRKKNKLGNNGFHFSLGGNNSNLSNKKDINRFKFNKKEDAILKKNLLFSSGYENIDWNEIANEIGTKNAFQIFVRNLELSNFYAYKKWNSIEDNILRKAILYYGPKNWQQISYCLDGRNNSQCFHRWMKGINPKIKRNKWSFEEDLTLGVALKIYGNKKWSKIANHLNGRTDIQCRERFCNILDPNLEEVEWKSTEDIKLLSLYEKYGNKWSKIAKEFGNRTDNTCWRRWKYLISLKNFNHISDSSTKNENTKATNYNTTEMNKSNIVTDRKPDIKNKDQKNNCLFETRSIILDEEKNNKRINYIEEKQTYKDQNLNNIANNNFNKINIINPVNQRQNFKILSKTKRVFITTSDINLNLDKNTINKEAFTDFGKNLSNNPVFQSKKINNNNNINKEQKINLMLANNQIHKKAVYLKKRPRIPPDSTTRNTNQKNNNNNNDTLVDNNCIRTNLKSLNQRINKNKKISIRNKKIKVKKIFIYIC